MQIKIAVVVAVVVAVIVVWNNWSEGKYKDKGFF